MGRKGKTQNHTAKEIAGKHAAAKYAAGGAGGGSEMQKQREAEKIKSMVTCEICKMGMPDLTSMKNHFDSKHSKEKWEDYEVKYKGAWAAIKMELSQNDKSKTNKLTGKAAAKAEKKAAEDAAAQKIIDADARAARKKLRESGGAAAVKDDAVAKEAATMKVVMPKVKKAQAFQDDEEYGKAIALYEEALKDFTEAGYKRPKLVERLEACRTLLEDAIES